MRFLASRRFARHRAVPFAILAALVACGTDAGSPVAPAGSEGAAERTGSSASALTSVPTGAWSQLETGVRPVAKPLTAFDSARSVVVLFTSVGSSTTWEWNGTTWTRRTPLLQPEPRIGASMAYDSARGRTVLFGGQINGAVSNDTWEWDGTNWEVASSTLKPQARSLAQLAFDARNGKLVLFGGLDGTGALPQHFADTWTWDGTEWAQATPAAAPSARRDMRLAYDSARERVVLHGGVFAMPATPGTAAVRTELNDTWEWDGATWVDTSTSARPPFRDGAAMAFDAVAGRLVLFGGLRGGTLQDETWARTTGDWTRLEPTARPPARAGGALAYDAARSELVLFGGTGTGVGSETWSLTGSAWARRASSSNPAAASVTVAMQFDRARNRPVLLRQTGAGAPKETWTFDGTRWASTPTAHAPDGVVARGALAYDSARGAVVYYGGAARGAVWAWDGSDWTETVPATTAPPARQAQALAFDEARGKLVLFGGTESQNANAGRADTWEWNGNDWTALTPAATPGTRLRPSLAYDAARSKVVLLAADAPAAQSTWEWDGTTWTARATTDAPASSLALPLAYDRDRQRIVTFGGNENGSATALTWELGASGWTRRTTAGAPSARFSHVFTYDTTNQKAVLFGSGSELDTWLFRVTPGPLGNTCGATEDCQSGFCVDGVCCNTACGGGAENDCQACTVAKGAPSDGTCSPVAAGRTCRAQDGVCDVAELCDGVAAACPADGYRAATESCRAKTDICDRVERCTGSSPSCPTDTLEPPTTVCETASECIGFATCTGQASSCPARRPSADGTACAGGVCAAGVCVPRPDAGPDSGPDAAPDSGPDAGPDSGSDAGPDSGGDASNDDADIVKPPVSLGADASIPSTPTALTPQDDSGCGCHTAPRKTPSGPLALAVVAVGAALARRRRRA